MKLWHVFVVFAIALVAIYASNNVTFLGNLTGSN